VRRHALPAFLLVLAVVSAAAAFRVGGPAAARAETAAVSGTPVLTPRRLPAVLAHLVGDARLRAGLDAAVHDPSRGAPPDRTCLVVRVGDRPFSAWNPTLPLAPASTLKLTVALAALDVLGPDRRFVTEVRATAHPVDGVVHGDLWLVGSGDPLLETDDYVAAFQHQPQVRTRYEDLADRLVASGVRRVEGRVAGDESRYDTQRHIPTWKPRYLTDFEAAPMSALVVNDGATAWTPHPPLDVHGATDAPAAHAGSVLVGLLHARGVEVAGGVAVGRVPAGAGIRVASVTSPPLVEVVGEMLRESDNTTAELLVKEMGRKGGRGGTTAAGLAVVRDALAARGLPVDQLHAVDGSGLDVGNRVTCELLVDLLRAAGQDGALARGLAVAGQTGTLSKRFLGTPVAGHLAAKSGSIKGVAALAGFASGRDGVTLTFAVIVNGVADDHAFALQNGVAPLLVAYPDVPAADELAP
jgi:D-alanyl-D-alanine carboxypeptidase/D-alanyl-D-alanine-endopeptidase (penicillin-binding protein 4)